MKKSQLKQIIKEEIRKVLNEDKDLLSLIQDYKDYDYTADQGYGTFTDDETGEEVDVVDNAEKRKEEIKAKIIKIKGPKYFELVDKYAGLSTYESEYAGPDDMEELTANKEETARKLGFTVDQLDNI